ncbi:hypothetical protein ACT3G6_20535, partial [Actibacterium sp. D379-3]
MPLIPPVSARRCAIPASLLRGLLLPGLLAAWVCTASPVAAENLGRVLQDARAGETIRLPGGQYGWLDLDGQRLARDVTIASADPSDPAVFSSVYIRGATNLTFDGILFDYTFQEGD